MAENKKVIWALFDSGTGSYKQAVTKYFTKEAEIYSVGIDIENKSTDFLNLDLGDMSEYFGDSKLFTELDKLPKPDIILASPPCFTGDTLVTTDVGYKRIDQINVGDKALTFTGEYKEVLNIGAKVAINNTDIYINGFPDAIKTTSNHPFLVSERINGLFHKPKKKTIAEVNIDSDFLAIPFNKNDINTFNLTEDELFNIGEYMASKPGSIDLFSSVQYLEGFISQEIPDFILNLDIDDLIHFYNGFTTRATLRLDGRLVYSTDNVPLYLSFVKVIHKIFREHPETVKYEVDEGTFYCTRWSEQHLNDVKNTYHSDYILLPIDTIIETDEERLVYNIEVADEHNYLVENVAVFNCESWSNASAMMSGNVCWYTDPTIKTEKPTYQENDFTIRTKEQVKTKDNTPFKKHWWKTVYSRLNGEACAFNTIRIIEHYKPSVWIIENPQPSRIWKYYNQIHNWEGVKNIAHYSAYEPEEFSKKPTCFYSNIEMNLKKMKPGEKSKLTFQGKGKNAISRSYNIRSKIPLSLIKDILEQAFKKVK